MKFNEHNRDKYISLLDLSVYPTPPGDWLMAVFKAYFDDSGEENDPQVKVCSVAGYVGTARDWRKFERLWKQTLDNPDYNVPYLHMKEFAPSNGPFDKWKHNESKRIAFIQSLIDVIRESNLIGVASILLIDDFQRFKADKGLIIDDYSFNLYNCMALMNDKVTNNKSVEVIVDRTNNVHKKIDKAHDYLATDENYPNHRDYINIIPLLKDITFRAMLPIQAADFIAWESRKDVDTKILWFSDPNKGDSHNEWARSLVDWCKKENRKFPYHRGSLTHLLNSVPNYGIAWDYNYLCQINNMRKGSWPV